MIQQPELGKKISKYRKAKGFTQEELVEKCNLSVRTLQRIEAGEVTPRIYTVKLIFEALELDYDNSLNSPKESNTRLVKQWLEQFYISFIDLFNLKTNTMKKITILSIMLSAIILGIFAVNTNLSAQNTDKQNQENKKVENSRERVLVFSDFSCYCHIEEKGLMIGRDVSFKLSGVKVTNLRLIAIDKKTREFNALFVKGKFLECKVEVEYPKGMLIDMDMNYLADTVKMSDLKITLKGNAKIVDLNDKENPDDDGFIEAEEIIIILK
jgi:transcriptional regulator with XRE-family HTH domain